MRFHGQNFPVFHGRYYETAEILMFWLLESFHHLFCMYLGPLNDTCLVEVSVCTGCTTDSCSLHLFLISTMFSACQKKNYVWWEVKATFTCRWKKVFRMQFEITQLRESVNTGLSLRVHDLTESIYSNRYEFPPIECDLGQVRQLMVAFKI